MTEAGPDRREYEVAGMSCEHCSAAVAEELIAVEGIEDVAVDLRTGAVEISGGGYRDEDVRAAVEAAGYELAAANGGGDGDD